jgi:putative methionine-R-sulfoxide reductase with GAF domain
LDAGEIYMATIPADIAMATDATVALTAIIRAFAAHTGTLHFLGTDGMLHLAAIHGAIPAPVMEHIRTIEIGKGMAGVCAELNEPVAWCNLNRDGSGVVQSGARSLGLAGSIVVPVRSGTAMVGTLGIANTGERTFTDEETALLIECGSSLLRFRPVPA